MVRNFKLFLQEECPQCGAPVEIEEASRLINCAYCGVTHAINFEPLPAFLLSSKEDASGYIPFWRIKGFYLVLTPKGVDFSPVDGTLCALKGKGHLSLGLRPRILPSRFLKKGLASRLILPEIGRKGFLSRYRILLRGTLFAEEEVFAETFWGTWLSLLYVPSNGLEESRPIVKDVDSFNVRFFPNICPHCGGTLRVEAGAEILFCPQCVSSWKIAPKGFSPVPHKFCSRPGDVWLPFWRIEAQVVGPFMAFSTLPAFAHLFSEDKISLLLPAFRIHPRLFLRLARQINLHKYPQEIDREILHNPFPAALPGLKAVELFQAIPIVLGELTPLVLRERILPYLKKTRFAFVGKELCWLPFKEGAYEYLQTESKVPIPKKVLGVGDALSRTK